MITSPDNAKLKQVRKLAARRERDRERLFVAEGEDLVDAAQDAGWAPEYLLKADEDVEPALLHAVSQLGSGTRVLGVYAQRWAEQATAPCLCLWGVGDPGNVGTVLRSALAFGAGCVALGPGTADPWAPKAVRASMGAVFRVPLVRVDAVGDLPWPVVGLDTEAPTALEAAVRGQDGMGVGTLVVGAERTGLPAGLVADLVSIPMPGPAESLNAAMAATVGLYELSRRMDR